MTFAHLLHYTDAELEEMVKAAEDDPEAHAILSGILDTRKANQYAQDQED